MSEKFALNFIKASHLFTTKLLCCGVTANGVQQLLNGEVITGLADRNKIARIILANKNEDIEVENDETHRSSRTETVGMDEKIMLQRAGISALGVEQCLNSQPITNTGDRGRLTLVVAAVFDKRILSITGDVFEGTGI